MFASAFLSSMRHEGAGKVQSTLRLLSLIAMVPTIMMAMTLKVVYLKRCHLKPWEVELSDDYEVPVHYDTESRLPSEMSPETRGSRVIWRKWCTSPSWKWKLPVFTDVTWNNIRGVWCKWYYIPHSDSSGSSVSVLLTFIMVAMTLKVFCHQLWHLKKDQKIKRFKSVSFHIKW